MITNHRQLSDEQFLSQLENGTIDPRLFNHEAHVRMAWLYLNQDGLKPALDSISKVIRQLDQQHGNGMKYHHTITISFSLIITLLIREKRPVSWEDLIAKNKALSDPKELLTEYYTDKTLYNEGSRTMFILPDKNPGAEFLRLVSDCEGLI